MSETCGWMSLTGGVCTRARHLRSDLFPHRDAEGRQWYGGIPPSDPAAQASYAATLAQRP